MSELQENVLIQPLHAADEGRKVAADKEDTAIMTMRLGHLRYAIARDLFLVIMRPGHFATVVTGWLFSEHPFVLLDDAVIGTRER